ncbi:hypothetical protein KKG90_07345 [Candidatus Bipolaricaulota bacterium]|nr:hypothetical protein [Candidatus Bipolaricaulota bacterium]
MTSTHRFRIGTTVFALITLLAIPMVNAWAQAEPGSENPDRQQPTNVSLFGGSAYEGGHLKYTYKVSREGVVGYSITTTEIIPQDDGTYRIENSSTDVVPLSGVNIAFFGISLRGLGFRIPSDQGGTVDLSPLESVEDVVLEPGREYILPDGGFLAVGEQGELGGLAVIYATYTHADFTNVRINLAMPVDIAIRNLLPIFPYLQLEYATDTLPEQGAEGDFHRMRSFSQIELIEFIYEQ